MDPGGMEWDKIFGALLSAGPSSLVLGLCTKALWKDRKDKEVTCAAEIAKKDADLKDKDQEIQELNDKVNALQEQRIIDLKAIQKLST